MELLKIAWALTSLIGLAMLAKVYPAPVDYLGSGLSGGLVVAVVLSPWWVPMLLRRQHP